MTGPAWAAYAVGEESEWSDACTPLETVRHVAHRRAALHIVEDDRIRAGLVYDKSILRTERLPVAWFSPNQWAYGSRYGNVEFSFSLEALLQEKTAYWVEVIDYKPKALRILLSAKDHSGDMELYDPTLRDGPWWFDAERERHFCRGDYCLEFMVEGDVSLSDCIGVEFVSHHDRWCAEHRNSPQDCDDLGLDQNKAGALFLCRLLAGPYPVNRMVLTVEKDGRTVAARAFSWAIENAYFSMMDWDQNIYRGGVHANAGAAVARSALSAYGAGRVDEAKALAGLFASDDEYFAAIAQFLCDRLGVASRDDLGLKNVF